MGVFNNREIAGGFWIAVFAVWAIRNAEVRKSILELARTFFSLKILVPVGVMALYVLVVVILLCSVGFWNMPLLKDTIIWFCISAMAMMMRYVTSEDAEELLQNILTDSVKVVVVLEFLVNTYTFSLPVELIVLPVVTVIGMLEVVAKLDKKNRKVGRLAEGAQAVIGLAIALMVLKRAIFDLKNLQSLETVRSIALAPLLSMLFVPLLYLMVLASRYELVFLRVELGSEKTRDLRRYARRRILIYGRLSLRRMQHLLKRHTVDLMHIQTKGDVDRLLESCKNCSSLADEGNMREGGDRNEAPIRMNEDNNKN